jgi:hypothetical protein
MSATKTRDKESKTQTITAPSSLPSSRWTPEVEAASRERQPGEDIWGQNGRLLREREEARAAVVAVIGLGRAKKISARDVEGLCGRYPWLRGMVG